LEKKEVENVARKMGIKPVFKVPEKPAIIPKCPYCKVGNMRTILVFDKRGPPI
jgi:hypothetical protein